MIEIGFAFVALMMIAGLFSRRAVGRHPFFFAYACILLFRSVAALLPIAVLSQGVGAVAVSWLEAILFLGLFAEICTHQLGMSRRLWMLGVGLLTLFAAVAISAAFLEADRAGFPSTRFLIPVQAVLMILVAVAGVRSGFARSRFAWILFTALVCNTLGRVGAVVPTITLAPVALGLMVISFLGFVIAAAAASDRKSQEPKNQFPER